MIVVEQGDRLVLVNSVRLSDEGLSALDAMGRVTDVIRLAGFHGVDDPFYKERYGATIHTVKGQAYFPGLDPSKADTYFESDNELTADSDLPIEGATLYSFSTAIPEAVLLLPAGGGTLVTGDSLQNYEGADEYFNFLGKIGLRLLGFMNPLQLGPAWLKQLKPDKDEIRGLLDLEFDHVLPGHGRPVIGGAKDKFRPTIEAYVSS